MANKKKVFNLKDFFESRTNDRSLMINIIVCVISFVIFYFLPSILSMMFSIFIKNEMLIRIVSNILTIFVIGSFYYKDLVKEFKELKNKTLSKFGTALMYYGLGFLVMVVSNFILLIIFKDISTNENQVREMLVSSPILMMFTISVLAPVLEELTFRKSLSPIFKSKYTFALFSGALFGFGHLMADITGGNFQILRLLYIVPYGSLGFVFALMNRDNKSTFSSIMIHSIHNFLTGLLILTQGGNL